MTPGSAGLSGTAREVTVARPNHSSARAARAEAHTLPDAELDVLACLWRQGEATTGEVRDMMRRYRPMAHGSVATLLGRLLAKGLVARRRAPVGKAFIYTPAKHARSGYRRVIGDVLDRIFGGNSVALVASLLETRPPKPDEIRQLQGLLDDLRKDRKQGRTE
jgi:BlaI family penicillinase repressor